MSPNTADIQLTYVIPCLNEEDTIALCIQECLSTLRKNNIKGEIIVVDNGSTDSSASKAHRAGARVIKERIKGYGSALRTGFRHAKGQYIFMADADMSHEFTAVQSFIEKLESGNFDLVIGCRFPSGGGTIEEGALPWMNQYVGNPVLSSFARFLFKSKIIDFHCGARLFKKEILNRLRFASTGMEFASEMIIKAEREKISIGQVPIHMRKSLRKRKPHLRPIRDGLRHVKTLLQNKINI